jgi:hypothetical protein
MNTPLMRRLNYGLHLLLTFLTLGLFVVLRRRVIIRPAAQAPADRTPGPSPAPADGQEPKQP